MGSVVQLYKIVFRVALRARDAMKMSSFSEKIERLYCIILIGTTRIAMLNLLL